VDKKETKVYYAHTDPAGLSIEQGGRWQRLDDHLRGTAELARQFAEAFGAGDWGDMAGLLHDLGKYADQFQRRLRNPSKENGRDHSTSGTAAILECYKHLGEKAALAVEGHHIGLQTIRRCYKDWLREIQTNLSIIEKANTYTDANFKLLLDRFQNDSLQFPVIRNGFKENILHNENTAAAAMLDVRMFFSTLVDADFLNTEAHFNGDDKTPLKYRPEGPALDAGVCIKRLKEYMNNLRLKNASSEGVQNLRDSLFTSCKKSADNPLGVFTLSAPTGTGKTLSMLAFALHHAKKHCLRRIVLVMPYLNIIEQTLKVYKILFNVEHGFPKHYILEDHSLAHQQEKETENDCEDITLEIPRLLAENWDAPIVLTTSVKCLESLMANRSSSCRKLHRLANSIILFDEVQTLPPKLVVPTLATLSRLADPNGPYKCSIVFSTATQPAFDHLHDQVVNLNSYGWKPREIVTDTKQMFSNAASRIQVTWRHDQPLSQDELVNEIMSFEQVLCIVNLKRHAKDIALKLRDRGKDNIYHLSTNMCPAHRRNVLDNIQQRLDPKKRLPICLIATQCVEAGVDLDFPVVYRALAPLESLAQAAGRCNRHGNQPQKGQVMIIRLASDGKTEFPPGYKEGVEATEVYLNLLKNKYQSIGDMDVFNNPEILRQYYQQFYDLTGRGKGERKDEKDLWQAIEAGDFNRVADEYKLIEQDSINILVPYNKTNFGNLVQQMDNKTPRNLEIVRQWIVAARPYSISIIRPKSDKSEWNCLKPIQFSLKEEPENYNSNWFRVLPEVKYDNLTGLEIPEGLWIA